MKSTVPAHNLPSPAQMHLRSARALRRAADILREAEAVRAESNQVRRHAREVLGPVASETHAGGDEWEAVFRITPDWTSVEAAGVTARDEHALAEFGPWTEAVPAEDRSRVADAIRQAIDHKEVVEIEHRLRCDDGRTRWVYTRAVPLLAGDGRISEWLCAASEVAQPPTEAAGT